MPAEDPFTVARSDRRFLSASSEANSSFGFAGPRLRLFYGALPLGYSFSGARAMTIVEQELLLECDAADLGPAATTDIIRTNFSMTAKFNPAKEHAVIFGETVTFAGHLTRGNITI